MTDTRLIRIIIAKNSNGKYVLDCMNTRKKSEMNISYLDNYRQLVVEIESLLREWEQAEGKNIRK